MMKSDHAKRASGGKPPLSFIPLSALEGAARVFEKGAAKYGIGNWQKGMPAMEYLDSFMRHLAKVQDFGIESIDDEKGGTMELNLDCMIANLIMLRWSLKHGVLADQSKWGNKTNED